MSTVTTSAQITAPEDHRRIAGAPISWGVCEVEGRGYQMPTARVLREMVALGLSATEFGPDGFLSNDSHGKVFIIAAPHLRAVDVSSLWCCTTPQATPSHTCGRCSMTSSPPAPGSSCSPPPPGHPATTSVRS